MDIQLYFYLTLFLLFKLLNLLNGSIHWFEILFLTLMCIYRIKIFTRLRLWELKKSDSFKSNYHVWKVLNDCFFFNDNFWFLLFLVWYFIRVTSKRKHAKLPLHRTTAIVGSIINHLSNLIEKRCGVER